MSDDKLAMEVTETDDYICFEFTDKRDVCLISEDRLHDWIASHPVVKDGPTEDGDWEVHFPMTCKCCNATLISEVAASDGFFRYEGD
jgi:hypothetical protein